ncbi:alpha-1,3-mannosyl-glycoprotein 4-beta-N-acetylglucosaminyltransferase C-like isoform X1 [Haliotis rufescens]|uniref:alpha-1,3-mannosyl-glycoprotein 4-beta-N-acetylglucosaminyltransferase C-like isoform X1 n=1 Tax=Haliotis rufescens TaxID=6454 RepID=UPI00201F74D0|nr:alpha-1,3-mannosyl-glycoprotein 4-beta-N-acetylglucosaminyltransferase C-like isoform X1 [Haliotis rufescens]XP_046381800.2 alpha-1,3-mannosyl-glycoprotein 4-beta-N-acetylglucosaminyltransferase C-like isoform X1 [Haliotis rufescens]
MLVRRWPRCNVRHWLLITMMTLTLTWLMWNSSLRTTACSAGTGTIMIDNNVERRYTQPRADMWGEAILLVGKPRLQKGFLTIGIPTVCRENGTYLLSTLRSLIDHSSETDRQNVTVVISVNDQNATYISELKHALTDEFSAHVLNGFIHMMRAPDSYYPSLDALRTTFGDAEYRVKWRSKQNLDYAFLMNYAKDLSEYYMQLEDDVTAAEGYVPKIRSYIQQRKHTWTMLDFSVMGYIGKLYKSFDIPKLANLLRSFYNEQPCDFLLLHFLNLMLQRKRFVRIPTLFNHVGYHSSLSNTTRNMVDVYFEGRVKKHKGDNPPAKLYTTISTFEDNHIGLAYNKSNTGRFFWGRNPNSGDSITVIFDEPQNVSSVAIETGHFADPERDRAHGAILEYGRRYTALVQPPSCIPIAPLGSFAEGRLDYHNGTISKVKCLRVTLTEKHKQWLIVKEIAVFL